MRMMLTIHDFVNFWKLQCFSHLLLATSLDICYFWKSNLALFLRGAKFSCQCLFLHFRCRRRLFFGNFATYTTTTTTTEGEDALSRCFELWLDFMSRIERDGIFMCVLSVSLCVCAHVYVYLCMYVCTVVLCVCRVSRGYMLYSILLLLLFVRRRLFIKLVL